MTKISCRPAIAALRADCKKERISHGTGPPTRRPCALSAESASAGRLDRFEQQVVLGLATAVAPRGVRGHEVVLRVEPDLVARVVGRARVADELDRADPSRGRLDLSLIH